MTNLPIRLAKGDPAPADCVAVPLHGPTGNGGLTWRDFAYIEGVPSLRAIADAAEAPRLCRICGGRGWTVEGRSESDPYGEQTRCPACNVAEAPHPLRKGDRVRVGFEGTIRHVDSDGLCYVQDETRPTPQRQFTWCWSECVTRIDDESEVDPDPLHYRDFAPDASTTADPRLDGPAITELLNVDEKEPAPDWTPSEGQLVERISDGVCCRLRYEPDDVLSWRLHRVSDAFPFGGVNSSDLIRFYRPRTLRVGDVISEAQGESGGRLIGLRGAAIAEFNPAGCAVTSNKGICPPGCLIHIEGLGPVPWPPTVEEVDE